jgi:hypothetical protein
MDKPEYSEQIAAFCVPQNAISIELCQRITEPILKEKGKKKQREEW